MVDVRSLTQNNRNEWLLRNASQRNSSRSGSYSTAYWQAPIAVLPIAQQAYSQDMYYDREPSAPVQGQGYWLVPVQILSGSFQYAPVSTDYPVYLPNVAASLQHHQYHPIHYALGNLPGIHTNTTKSLQPQYCSQHNSGAVGTLSIAPPPSRSVRSKASTLKGPPRKPKQTGYAMWLGNLDVSTTLEEILLHFSSPNLMSALMIKKAACAFLNYASEVDVLEAVSTYNKTVFKGAEVSCHSRKTGSPAGSIQDITLPAVVDEEPLISAGLPDLADRILLPTRYFILKSLDNQQLEISVQTGVWITQRHNVPVLNEAFANSKTVYLIFSANKSGEFYGYARMVTPINQSSMNVKQIKEKDVHSNTPKHEDPSSGLIKVRSFPASGSLRQGTLYEDLDRKSLFWEADDSLKLPSEEQGTTPPPLSAEGHSPFRVEWRKVGRISFNKTKTITNKWNHNREIKISRDGTELDTIAGHQVVRLFDQIGYFVSTPSIQ